MVMGDFNAAISESIQGVVGPYGLSKVTNDNGERLVSFASANGMCAPYFHTSTFTKQPGIPQTQEPVLVSRTMF